MKEMHKKMIGAGFAIILVSYSNIMEIRNPGSVPPDGPPNEIKCFQPLNPTSFSSCVGACNVSSQDFGKLTLGGFLLP